MTYSSGGLIQATDYNGFVSTTAFANVNNIWAFGSVNAGWGQTALPTVSTAGTVTATQWASLVNTIASMGAHTGTTITSRTAPTTGSIIAILAALNTDLSAISSNANRAAQTGPQYTSWIGTNSKTTATSGATWGVLITNTVTWPSGAAAARYFFNAGGRIKLDFSKTSTGALGDPEWNDLLNTLCGDIYFTGTGTSKTIAGTAYTGTTKIGGTGTPSTLATGTGFYNLTPGGAAVTIYQQFADTAPYTSNSLRVQVALNAASTVLTFTTLLTASDGDPISGGTAPTGAVPGTAPCVICTYFSPSTTYLSNSWGTPTVVASLS